jgi:L-lactate permease
LASPIDCYSPSLFISKLACTCRHILPYNVPVSSLPPAQIPSLISSLISLVIAVFVLSHVDPHRHFLTSHTSVPVEDQHWSRIHKIHTTYRLSSHTHLSHERSSIQFTTSLPGRWMGGAMRDTRCDTRYR